MIKSVRQRFARIFKAAYSEINDYWYTPRAISTRTGVEVNEITALTFTAVWACVRAISETIASLPLHVYKRLDNGGKERAVDHPLYQLLHTQPNPEMTSMQYREVAQSHILLWGNHYSNIQRNRRGDVMALWPLDPSRMKVKRDTETTQLIYEYIETEKGNIIKFDSDEIIHIAGLGFNGLIGYSPIAKEREAIGLGMAQEEMASRFFGNDGTPGIILKHPGRLSPDAHTRLQNSWNEAHSGLKNKWKPAILEEGITIDQITMPLKDAQFLEGRKFQVLEICRIFNVPPYKVMDFDRATFSNVEQAAIDWVVHSIRPWLVRWEQALVVKLFTLGGKSKYFAEHLVDGLLRGDIASRYAAYQIARQNGIMNADEWRELENMNPQPEDKGKIYYINAAMVPVGEKRDPESSSHKIENEEDDMSEEERMELESFRKSFATINKELKELREKTISQENEISAFPSQIEANQQKNNVKLMDLSEKIVQKDELIKKLSEEKDSQVNSLNGKIIIYESQINEIKKSYPRVFMDAVQRILRREQIGIKRAIQKKDITDFQSHIEEFYQELPEFISTTLHPAVITYAQFMNSTGGINFISDFISKHINESKAELKQWDGVYIHNSGNGELKRNDKEIEDCLDLWMKKRPEKAVNCFISFFSTS